MRSFYQTAAKGCHTFQTDRVNQSFHSRVSHRWIKPTNQNPKTDQNALNLTSNSTSSSPHTPVPTLLYSCSSSSSSSSPSSSSSSSSPSSRKSPWLDRARPPRHQRTRNREIDKLTMEKTKNQECDVYRFWDVCFFVCVCGLFFSYPVRLALHHWLINLHTSTRYVMGQGCGCSRVGSNLASQVRSGRARTRPDP